METITLTIEDLAKLQAGLALAVLETVGMPIRPIDYVNSYNMCLNDLKKDTYQKQLSDFNKQLYAASN